MTAGFGARLGVVGLALAAAAGSLLAAEVEPKVARDLLTVITMEGLPCGEVLSAVRHADEDYTASCRSGDQYRVRIVNERVEVERVSAPRAGESPQG